MTSLLVSIETTGLQRVVDNMTRITPQSIGALALSSVNKVAQRGYDESVKRMLSRYNLTEDYIRDRMLVEPANEARRPEAVIVALRSGGRRPGIRPTNLRTYAVAQIKKPVRWPNSTPQIAKNQWGKNPRKAGGFLKWKKRTGAPHLGIEVGQKQAGIRVEVKRGSQKELPNAFYAAGRRGTVAGGQGLLVFERVPGASGKGKLRALYSQSVWQMFRRISAEIIPIVRDDLERTVADDVLAEVAQEIVK